MDEIARIFAQGLVALTNICTGYRRISSEYLEMACSFHDLGWHEMGQHYLDKSDRTLLYINDFIPLMKEIMS